jgi:hypothetical protein
MQVGTILLPSQRTKLQLMLHHSLKRPIHCTYTNTHTQNRHLLPKWIRSSSSSSSSFMMQFGHDYDHIHTSYSISSSLKRYNIDIMPRMRRQKSYFLLLLPSSSMLFDVTGRVVVVNNMHNDYQKPYSTATRSTSNVASTLATTSTNYSSNNNTVAIDIDDADDINNRNQRKVLLDAINHIVKKQKYFWTIQQLNLQTQLLLDYCNDRENHNTNSTTNSNNSTTPIVKKKNAIDNTKSITTYKYGRPSSNTFFEVLEAWMERSMIMAEQQQQIQQQPSQNSNSESGVGSTSIDCAERARLLLDAMLPKRDIYQPHIVLNNTRYVQNSKIAFLKTLLQTSHYEVVLQAYAVSNGGLPAAIRAESLLSQMIARCRSFMKTKSKIRKGGATSSITTNHIKMHDRPPEPTLKTFNIVLNCWAKSCAYEAADRVMALLILMEQWHETYSTFNNQHQKRRSYRYAGCLPNERSILCLIEAWTNGRPNEAPEVALQILKEIMIATDYSNDTNTMETTRTGKYRNVQLDEAVFNAVIYAWVRSNRGRSAAIQAEEILQMMIQWSQVSNNSKNNRIRPVEPTTRTYSMIIMAWAECEAIENKGDAANRAETILMKMVQSYSDGKHNNVKPNSILFTSCIAAWSRAASNCIEAPDRAEQLWSLLRQLYSETGSKDIDFEPTTQIGNAVISAWSRCTSRVDSVERALGALEILKQENKDDLISYNTVLDAMSKKGYAKDAMKLLQWLVNENNYHHHKLVPDLVSYNSVLASFARSPMATKSATTTTTATPTPTPTTLQVPGVTVHEDSNYIDENIHGCVAEESEKLLRQMEQMERLKPNKKSYTCKSYFYFPFHLTFQPIQYNLFTLTVI